VTGVQTCALPISDGGELRIEIEPAMLQEEAAGPGRPAVPAGRYARIAVSDTGVGMSALVSALIPTPVSLTAIRA